MKEEGRRDGEGESSREHIDFAARGVGLAADKALSAQKVARACGNAAAKPIPPGGVLESLRSRGRGGSEVRTSWAGKQPNEGVPGGNTWRWLRILDAAGHEMLSSKNLGVDRPAR